MDPMMMQYFAINGPYDDAKFGCPHISLDNDPYDDAILCCHNEPYYDAILGCPK